ncbi:MAG: hypothetical protein R3F27_09625 [Gammaproteobacteria bacterium]
MKLDDTKRLLDRNLEESDPMDLLVNVLEAAVELISIEGMTSSGRPGLTQMRPWLKFDALLAQYRAASCQKRADVAILFAPTGPIQEVSLSSGWAEAFLKVAERYDYAEQKLWG